VSCDIESGRRRDNIQSQFERERQAPRNEAGQTCPSIAKLLGRRGLEWLGETCLFDQSIQEGLAALPLQRVYPWGHNNEPDRKGRELFDHILQGNIPIQDFLAKSSLTGKKDEEEDH